jgi:putative flippase GtrA
MVLTSEHRRAETASGPRIARWPGLDAARYLLASLASVGVDFSIFSLLTAGYLSGGHGLDPLVAHAISRPLGGLTCFYVNRSWTFRARGRRPMPVQLARFWCVFGVSLVLTGGLIEVFCKGLGLPPVPGKALAEAMVWVFNFLALKHWTFR